MESTVFTLSLGVVFGGLMLIFLRQVFGSERAGSTNGSSDAELPHIGSGSDSSSGDSGGGASSD